MEVERVRLRTRLQRLSVILRVTFQQLRITMI